jgi:hypothetical protein
MDETNSIVEDLTFEFFVNQRHLVLKLSIIGSTVLRLNGSHSVSRVDLHRADVFLLSNYQH